MNKNALKSKMALLGMTADDLLKRLSEKNVHMVKSTLWKKMNGKSEFTRKEIMAISEVLEMDDSGIMDVFFNEKVS